VWWLPTRLGRARTLHSITTLLVGKAGTGVGQSAASVTPCCSDVLLTASQLVLNHATRHHTGLTAMAGDSPWPWCAMVHSEEAEASTELSLALVVLASAGMGWAAQSTLVRHKHRIHGGAASQGCPTLKAIRYSTSFWSA
jgi:hypothetical protein